MPESVWDSKEARQYYGTETGVEHPDFQVQPLQPEGAARLPQLPQDHQLRSHATYGPRGRQPDDEPLDWRNYVHPSAPSHPFPIRRVKPSASADDGLMHSPLDANLRAAAWVAYEVKTDQADAAQHAIKGDYDAFYAAQNSPELRALGFVLPEGWQGDVDSLADQQHVSGGTSMRSLFRPDDSLNMTKSDARGAATAQRAFEEHGAGKGAHDRTIAADYDLRGRLLAFATARDNVARDTAGVDAAQAEIEKVEAESDVQDDKEKLATAKSHAELIKSELEFVVGGALRYMLAEGAVDAAESLGTMASFALSKVSERSIDSIEAKLRVDEARVKQESAKHALEMLKQAKAALAGTMKALGTARADVFKAMMMRKQVYEAAGQASAAASGGDSHTQGKLTASMAAIPIAETVLGMIQNLAAQTTAITVPYNTEAGRGFHMAVLANQPEVPNFVALLGNLESMRAHFAALNIKWSGRLAALQKMRTQLGGARPGAHADVDAALDGPNQDGAPE